MSISILVVDDSSTIQKIFKISLSRHAVEVKVASSYLEALNVSVRTKSDLLVVDANLPGIKGPQELLQLQAENDGAPVLILAGSHEPFDDGAYRAAGLVHHLKKPFEAHDIIRAVALVFGRELPMKASSDNQELSRPSIALSSPLSDGGGYGPAEHELPPLPDGFEGVRRSIPMPDELSTDMLVPPPPPGRKPGTEPASPFDVDETRRGRRAFQEPPTKSTGIGFSLPSDDLPETIITDAPPPKPDAWRDSGHANVVRPIAPDFDEQSRQIDELKNKLEDFLRGEAPVVVRKAVEKYCEAHFAQLARDVLTSELRRLAEEKSRLLSN